MADERKLMFRYELRDDRHDIDVMALANGLGQYCTFLNFLSDSTRDDAVLNIRVEALRPGSFEVYLKFFELGQGVLGTVISNNFVGPISNVFEMFRQFVEIKNLLGSEKADHIYVGDNSTVNIIKGSNNVVVYDPVWRAYKESKELNESLYNGSLALLSDEQIEGLKIQDITPEGHQDVVNLDRTSLGRMASSNAYLQEEIQVVTVDNALLLLVSSNFEFTGMWRFEYGAHVITVKFEDEDFISKVREGLLNFRSKDIFTVNMKVEQRRLPGSRFWEDKKYVISKVKSINNLRDI
ncbi:hypothetical protein [Cloacibacillus evryensis]|uniref:hypothetical protein n=1 Tax=Cloacibacillus evryensis TaxID=508460 RepID=UPI00210A7C6B|nr:hypothetical protein [Cloacibacillus evryensis]MCQ4764792.1 hypothetical protein [Cloacibacillus evryensis]